jgi:hypothetical protein
MATRNKRQPNPDKPALAIVFDKPELDRLRELAGLDERRIAFLVRRAVKYWLDNSREAKLIKLKDRTGANDE